LVGDDNTEYYIHEKLAIANSPFLAETLKKGEMKIGNNPILFKYFFAWLYDKDGDFKYQIPQNSRPYLQLVRLHMIAYKLRVPSFANAVHLEIIQTYNKTRQVVDNKTVALLYKEQLEDHEIHELFADQVAYRGLSQNFATYDNLQFVKAVLDRLPLIRDGRQTHPPPETYYITTIEDPEPEEEDDDECMFLGERPATEKTRSEFNSGIKRERSATVVSAPPTEVEA
jgi:hypothetical protein